MGKSLLAETNRSSNRKVKTFGDEYENSENAIKSKSIYIKK